MIYNIQYTILYYTILYYTILYYTILYYTILYYIILYYTILYYIILYYTILYYTIFYYTILYYTILYYNMLYYTILYYIILYYTILYYTISGAESTLKVWVYFNIFPNFVAFQKVGGVTKSRPIDPVFDVIYLFLNVRFGQKAFKFTVFGCHDLRFGCIIWYFLLPTQHFLVHFPKLF